MGKLRLLCYGMSPATEGLSGGEVVMVMQSLTPVESGLTAPSMKSMETEAATPPTSPQLQGERC